MTAVRAVVATTRNSAQPDQSKSGSSEPGQFGAGCFADLDERVVEVGDAATFEWAASATFADAPAALAIEPVSPPGRGLRYWATGRARRRPLSGLMGG
jgi:hypothetical protein